MRRIFLNEWLFLAVLTIFAFLVRLYQIDAPLADWHSWRQADTAAVSRNFIKNGYDVFHPRFDDLSNLVSRMENPQGYRFVEFPFYNLLHAFLAQSFPARSLEWWGRMISILFSLGSMLLLYFLVKKYLGKLTAFLAAFFFAFLPFYIYYSRVILPEPMMVFSTLTMIFFFSQWLERKRFTGLYYFLFFVFASISLLLKPFMIFLFPVLFYLAWRKWGFAFLKQWPLYLAGLAVVPFLLWRWWMNHYPEGIPYYPWLFNHQGIRFKGAFFRWLFGERMGKLILGYWGLVPFALGISTWVKKEGWLFHWWLVGILLYFTVIAGGNVIHDYYQIIAIPIICILLAKGGHFLLFAPKQYFNKFLCSLLFVACSLFMFAFSWYEVRGFFNINHPEILAAGRKADQILPQGAKVIAPYENDTAFLYQTNRQGWPVVVNSLDYLISLGATHYVSVWFDENTREAIEKFKVLEQTDDYVIVDLTQRK
jgi:4-amino-4-deoxy-L-arabinose transferase-like glycosyltransferase